MNRACILSLLLSAFLFSGCSRHTAQPPTTPILHPTKTKPKPTANHDSAAEHASADKAFDTVRALLEGNTRFVTQSSEHPHQDETRRLAVATGQKPHTIVLSCSDSRVPPEIVFDQGLGDLFVVRTAGEVPDSAAIASMEYAVEHLGATKILVMGHTSCGAVKAALTTAKGQSAGSPDLDKLVKQIQPNVGAITVDSAGPGLVKAVTAQSKAVAVSLAKHSHILREAVHAGHLEIIPAVYFLETGVVQIYR